MTNRPPTPVQLRTLAMWPSPTAMMTVQDMAEIDSVTVWCAGMRLLAMARRGLLQRTRKADPSSRGSSPYEYRLTDAGCAVWLRLDGGAR